MLFDSLSEWAGFNSTHNNRLFQSFQSISPSAGMWCLTFPVATSETNSCSWRRLPLCTPRTVWRRSAIVWRFRGTSYLELPPTAITPSWRKTLPCLAVLSFSTITKTRTKILICSRKWNSAKLLAILPWLHVKWNHFEISSAFVDVSLK